MDGLTALMLLETLATLLAILLMPARRSEP